MTSHTKEVAVIVGGGPSISASCGRLFSNSGMQVALAARNPEKEAMKQLEKDFDAVLVVTASTITQRNRVLGRKNITDKDFQLIKRNQLGEEEKIKKADFVINTDRSLTETMHDVVQIYEKIIELVR